jgi:hypothetical protein
MTEKQHDEGLEFAKQLRILARRRAPDRWAEAQVHQLVNRFEVRYGYSWPHKKAMVVKLLRSDEIGSVEAVDVIDRYGWHKDDVYNLLREMAVEGTLEEFKVPRGDKGGRPLKRYRLKTP